MSKRDERLAEKYAAQGKRSATETRKAKEATRAERRSGGSGASDIEQRLRNFDYSNPKPIERDDASRQRAQAHQESARPRFWGRATGD